MTYAIGVIFAISAAILNAGYALVGRAAMKRESDTITWGILYQFLAGIAYLIPAILFLKLPDTGKPYYYAIGASLIWGIYIILSWASYRETPVSVRQTLNATKNIFIIAFAFVLLGEAVTTNKIIGAAVIIFGVYVLSRNHWLWSQKGTFLTLGSAASQAAARTLDKFAIAFFSTPAYAAVQYFLPAFWVSLTQKNLVKRCRKLLKKMLGWLLLAVIVGGAAAYFQFESYRRLDVGTAVLIMELSTVFATIGGIVLLKEKERIAQKILGSLIVTMGVIIIATF